MKTVGFVLLWLLGSIAAVSVAFAGIALVDDDLVAPPAAQVANLNEARPTATASTAPAQTSVAERATLDGSVSVATNPTTTDSLTLDPEAATTAPADDAQRSLEAAASTIAPTATTGSTTATTSPLSSAESTSTVPSTSSTTTVAPQSSSPEQIRTFNLVGGTTAISFSSTAVEVLWATPNPGFDVEIKPGSSSVRVEFESNEHKSRIDAWWSDGPQQAIREDD
ncbi:MAG: hypothetical protein R8J94_17900 [Acidimicrobiia bacterium]|nr:hypothetical protein [Acidimicrobiia bacterium]